MFGQSIINLNQENLANGSIVFFGLDYSLTHYSLLAMDKDFKVLDYICGSQKNKDIKALDGKGHLIEADDEDDERRDFYRGTSSLDGIYRFIAKYSAYVKVIAIENYAFSASSSRLLQLAEWLGCIKTVLWSQGFYIRMIDPTSVKLFATGFGNALKKDVVESAKRLGFIVPDCLLISKSKKKTDRKTKTDYKVDDLDGIGTDLADSYYIARIATTEVLLRFGLMDLKELNEGERRIFLRTTKSNPVNLLDKEYISL